MNAQPLQMAANEPGMVPGRPVQVVSARFVTIELASVLTGLTEGAIRMKISRGVWLEDRHFIKRDGRVHIDMKAYENWVQTGI